jgi:hypothetical protein
VKWISYFTGQAEDTPVESPSGAATQHSTGQAESDLYSFALQGEGCKAKTISPGGLLVSVT